jgi:hypothetical protein
MNKLRTWSRRSLLTLYRRHQIPEHEIPAIIRHNHIIFNCLLNAMIAAICAYVIILWIYGNASIALEIAACMVAVGYRLRILPNRNDDV